MSTYRNHGVSLIRQTMHAGKCGYGYAYANSMALVSLYVLQTHAYLLFKKPYKFKYSIFLSVNYLDELYHKVIIVHQINVKQNGLASL